MIDNFLMRTQTTARFLGQSLYYGNPDLFGQLIGAMKRQWADGGLEGADFLKTEFRAALLSDQIDVAEKLIFGQTLKCDYPADFKHDLWSWCSSFMGDNSYHQELAAGCGHHVECLHKFIEIGGTLPDGYLEKAELYLPEGDELVEAIRTVMAANAPASQPVAPPLSQK